MERSFNFPFHRIIFPHKLFLSIYFLCFYFIYPHSVHFSPPFRNMIILWLWWKQKHLIGINKLIFIEKWICNCLIFYVIEWKLFFRAVLKKQTNEANFYGDDNQIFFWYRNMGDIEKYLKSAIFFLRYYYYCHSFINRMCENWLEPILYPTMWRQFHFLMKIDISEYIGWTSVFSDDKTPFCSFYRCRFFFDIS